MSLELIAAPPPAEHLGCGRMATGCGAKGRITVALRTTGAAGAAAASDSVGGRATRYIELDWDPVPARPVHDMP